MAFAIVMMPFQDKGSKRCYRGLMAFRLMEKQHHHMPLAVARQLKWVVNMETVNSSSITIFAQMLSSSTEAKCFTDG